MKYNVPAIMLLYVYNCGKLLLMIQYTILVACWVLYGVLHSLLAANRVKQFFHAAMGTGFRYYRSLYNFIAIIALLAVLFYSATIPAKLLVPDNWTNTMKFIGLVFTTWGIVVIRMAFRQYNIREFLGFRAGNEKNPRLITSGIFKYVRHPIYSGTLLILWGFLLFSPTYSNLITVSCLIIYLLTGMRLEEKKLVEEFGEPYRNYQAKVSALIPKIKF